MAVTNDFLDFVCDQLAGAGEVTTRRMFGAVGLYLDGVFIAILDDDILYLKVDDGNRADYEKIGSEPIPVGGGITLSFYNIPADILEDHDRLCAWARKAFDAGVRALEKKKAVRPRSLGNSGKAGRTRKERRKQSR